MTNEELIALAKEAGLYRCFASGETGENGYYNLIDALTKFASLLQSKATVRGEPIAWHTGGKFYSVEAHEKHDSGRLPVYGSPQASITREKLIEIMQEHPKSFPIETSLKQEQILTREYRADLILAELKGDSHV